jgi:hypothetical protein
MDHFHPIFPSLSIIHLIPHSTPFKHHCTCEITFRARHQQLTDRHPDGKPSSRQINPRQREDANQGANPGQATPLQADGQRASHVQP